MQGEEFEVGANDENPNFQRVPDHPSDENPHVLNHSRPNPPATIATSTKTNHFSTVCVTEVETS